MIDLEPAHLRKIKNILSGSLPEFDVMVYGISASGPAKKYSYLDLAVMSEKPLPSGRLEKLAAEFTAARFPFKVETVDWAASGKDFRKVIKKTGVLIQHSAKK